MLTFSTTPFTFVENVNMKQDNKIIVRIGNACPDEYKANLQRALITLLKQPFKDQKVEFDTDETTAFSFVMKFLEDLMPEP